IVCSCCRQEASSPTAAKRIQSPGAVGILSELQLKCTLQESREGKNETDDKDKEKEETETTSITKGEGNLNRGDSNMIIEKNCTEGKNPPGDKEGFKREERKEIQELSIGMQEVEGRKSET
ncbi:hypothetical protein Pfo_001277, partial [Paulownia fortunei]